MFPSSPLFGLISQSQLLYNRSTLCLVLFVIKCPEISIFSPNPVKIRFWHLVYITSSKLENQDTFSSRWIIMLWFLLAFESMQAANAHDWRSEARRKAGNKCFPALHHRYHLVRLDRSSFCLLVTGKLQEKTFPTLSLGVGTSRWLISPKLSLSFASSCGAAVAQLVVNLCPLMCPKLPS